MMEIDVEQILNESLDLLNESGSGGRIPHLYEDYKMTFNEMRQIFRNIFSGKTTLTEKCVSPDTKITLEHNGEKSIKEIVDNKINDNVLTYDSNTRQLCYKPILRWLCNNIKTEWIRIKLEDGKEIICTPEHRFYKDGNDIEAKDLKIGDYVTSFQ